MMIQFPVGGWEGHARRAAGRLGRPWEPRCARSAVTQGSDSGMVTAPLFLPRDAADEPVASRIPLRAAADVRPPLWQRHQAGFEYFPVAEPAEDLLAGTPSARARFLVEQLLHRHGLRRVFPMLRTGHAEAGNGEIAADGRASRSRATMPAGSS